MKKVLVLCGGSGPKNLLEGLHKTDVMKNAKVQVLINALDNGLSTGQCRQIFGGQLLGPSDVRKNAMTRYNQLHGKTELSEFLDERFNCSSKDAEEYVIGKIRKLNPDNAQLLFKAAYKFFEQPLAKTIDYQDFSMSNLIYSGVAALNGMSLYEASKVIAREILNIEEDFVLLNSDKSVFINAVTASGKILTDEVDIDEWDHIEDRIQSIFFTNPEGQKIAPPDLHPDADKAIREADIIIYSSGTQWTSLIPTYATTGFKAALNASDAKQFLVMNNVADTDMTGLTSADIVNVLKEYLPMENITVVLNSQAHGDMCIAPDGKGDIKFIIDKLSDSLLTSQHDGTKLVKLMLQEYFKRELAAVNNGATILMDYDDTLVGRNGSFKNASKRNIEALKKTSKEITSKLAIVSGNSIRCIDNSIVPGFTVFADNACNEYMSVTTNLTGDYAARTRYKLVKPVKEELVFTQAEVDAIVSVITGQVGVDISKITNKGFAGIGIKPVASEYRKAIATLIKMLIDPLDDTYEVIVAGRTTIDIYKKGARKMNVVGDFLKNGNVLYIGDEWESGNDSDVFKESLTHEGLTFLRVDDPADTVLFFNTLLSSKGVLI